MRTGRPPKPAEQRQTKRIGVHLTPSERERLDQARGLVQAATYIRDLVVRELERKGRAA